MIGVLSPTSGMRAQTSSIDEKIRAFFVAGIRDGEETGRSSATGSPRRSIVMTPPSAASRTNAEV
jgi:hypothetical protein